MDRDKLISFYQELEFKSLLKELMPPVKSIVKTNIEVVDDLLRLKEILLPYSALVFETFDENYHRSPLLYVGLKNRLGTFIIRPEWIGQSIDLQLFLSDSQNHKSIYDYKKAYVLLKQMGIELNGIDFDLLLAGYILNPSIGKEEFKIVSNYFDYTDVLYEEEVYGKGAKKVCRKTIYCSNTSPKSQLCLFFEKRSFKTVGNNRTTCPFKRNRNPACQSIGQDGIYGNYR